MTTHADRAPAGTLHVLGGPARGQVWHLGPGAHVLGRAADSDLRVNDPGVSRRHCRVVVAGRPGAVTIEDLGSGNGTLVDGVWAGRPIPLRPGGTVVVGNSTLGWAPSDRRPAAPPRVPPPAATGQPAMPPSSAAADPSTSPPATATAGLPPSVPAAAAPPPPPTTAAAARPGSPVATAAARPTSPVGAAAKPPASLLAAGGPRQSSPVGAAIATPGSSMAAAAQPPSPTIGAAAQPGSPVTAAAGPTPTSPSVAATRAARRPHHVPIPGRPAAGPPRGHVAGPAQQASTALEPSTVRLAVPRRIRLPRSASPPRPETRSALLSTVTILGALATLAVLGVLTGLPLLFPPLAASMALIAAGSALPLAQPRNVVGGHVMSALVGFAAVLLIGSGAWAAALAGACALGVMLLLRMSHSPAVGTAVIVGATAPAALLFLEVLLLAAMILLVFGIVGARLEGKKYPVYWW